MISTLEAVRDRQPMRSNIFDLKRAEQGGMVTGQIANGVYRWSLTPDGEAALAKAAAQ